MSDITADGPVGVSRLNDIIMPSTIPSKPTKADKLSMWPGDLLCCLAIKAGMINILELSKTPNDFIDIAIVRAKII